LAFIEIILALTRGSVTPNVIIDVCVAITMILQKKYYMTYEEFKIVVSIGLPQFL
jgi:hypothetical protein